MKFRPCIDIHNGKVKQIVGGSLQDAGDQAKENFVSTQDAAFYAKLPNTVKGSVFSVRRVRILRLAALAQNDTSKTAP